MIHFLALTPVFFGTLKQHPKFSLPNFSLWELQPDDVRLHIRCHWSSQAGLCHQLPAAAPSPGVRCGPGRWHDRQPRAVLRLGVMGHLYSLQEMPSAFSIHLSVGLGKLPPKGRGSSLSISKPFQNAHAGQEPTVCLKKRARPSSLEVAPIHLPH